MSCESAGHVIAEEWIGDILYLHCLTCNITEKYDCTLLGEKLGE